MLKMKRRSVIKKLFASTAALVGANYVTKANGIREGIGSVEKKVGEVTNLQDQPLMSSHTQFNNTIYLSGIGAHVEPFEIKAHTKIVLDALEKELIKAGSSMDKVLKVSVFLANIEDYDGMNEVYKGRFGARPPVRTTIAVGEGRVPGDSLVEIDCIAHV